MYESSMANGGPLHRGSVSSCPLWQYNDISRVMKRGKRTCEATSLRWQRSLQFMRDALFAKPRITKMLCPLL